MTTDDPQAIEFRVTDDLAGHGGLAIHADGYGSPTDPPALLVHGGGQTRHSWGGTAAELAAHEFHAVTYDQRGHGESDRSPSGHYEVGRFAEDLAEIATTFAEPPSVIGASLGGLAGLIAEGLLEPGVLAALVLVDITPRQERAGVERIIGFMLDRAEEGFASLDEAADAVAAYQPQRPRPTNFDGLRKNLRLDPDNRWRWHWDPLLFNAERGLGRRASGASGGLLEQAARNIACPTLLVRGRLSDVASEETVQEFLELVPHAEYVDVSGAGHMVAGDRNDAFTGAVVEFLRRTIPR